MVDHCGSSGLSAVVCRPSHHFIAAPAELNMNASKRYVLGGGVVAVIVIGLIVGAIRPGKHAQAAPTIVPG